MCASLSGGGLLLVKYLRTSAVSPVQKASASTASAAVTYSHVSPGVFCRKACSSMKEIGDHSHFSWIYFGTWNGL